MARLSLLPLLLLSALSLSEVQGMTRCEIRDVMANYFSMPMEEVPDEYRQMMARAVCAVEQKAQDGEEDSDDQAPARRRRQAAFPTTPADPFFTTTSDPFFTTPDYPFFTTPSDPSFPTHSDPFLTTPADPFTTFHPGTAFPSPTGRPFTTGHSRPRPTGRCWPLRRRFRAIIRKLRRSLRRCWRRQRRVRRVLRRLRRQRWGSRRRSPASHRRPAFTTASRPKPSFTTESGASRPKPSFTTESGASRPKPSFTTGARPFTTTGNGATSPWVRRRREAEPDNRSAIFKVLCPHWAVEDLSEAVNCFNVTGEIEVVYNNAKGECVDMDYDDYFDECGAEEEEEPEEDEDEGEVEEDGEVGEEGGEDGEEEEEPAE